MRIATAGTATPITSLTGYATSITSFAVSADGRTLVAGDIDGRIDVWQLDAPSLLRNLCRQMGSPITAEQWAVYVGTTDFQPPSA